MSKVTQKKAKDGTVSHYLGRKLHRLDGPAQEMVGGTKKYFISGLELTEKQFKICQEQGVTEFKKNSADPDYYWYKVNLGKYVELWTGRDGNELLISTKKASATNSLGTTGNFAKFNFNGNEEYYFETKTEYKYLDKEEWLQKMGANYLDPVKKEYSKVWLYGKAYYKDDVLSIYHRDGGLPAIEYNTGDKEYWVDGKRHRLDGPAFERKSGHQEYWVNGVRHRLDGPAIEYVNGGGEYYIGGVFFSKDDFEKEIAKTKGYSKVLYKGTDNEKTIWYKDEACTIIHREGDLPAIEHKNGITKEYWLNGKPHREGDQPCYISPTLTQWALNGNYCVRPGDQPNDITSSTLLWYDGNFLKRRVLKTESGWEIYEGQQPRLDLKGNEYRGKTYFEAMEIYKQKELLTHEWFGEKITKEEHEKRSKEWVTRIDSGATSKTIFFKNAAKSTIAKIVWDKGAVLEYTDGKPSNLFHPGVGTLLLTATVDGKHYSTDTTGYTFENSDISCPVIHFKRSDEEKQWSFNGVFQSFKGEKYHNEFGPATIDIFGETFYINGYKFDSKENWEQVKSKYTICNYETSFERTCFYQNVHKTKLISHPTTPSIVWSSGAKAWANDKGEIVKMETASSVYLLDTTDGKLKNKTGNLIDSPLSANPIVISDDTNYWRLCGRGIDGSEQYRSGIGITNKADYDQYLKNYSIDAGYKRFFYYDKENTKIRRVQWDNATAWLDFDTNGEPVAIQLKDEPVGKNLQAVGKFLVDPESSLAYWLVAAASKWSDPSVDFGTREIRKGEKISQDLYKGPDGYSKDPYGLILHRIDGPAVNESFYLEGKLYTLSAYNKKLKEMGLPPVGRVGSTKLAENSYEYNSSIFKDPECLILHCETGPAKNDRYYLDGVCYASYPEYIAKLRELGLPIPMQPGVIKLGEECYQKTSGSVIKYYKDPECLIIHRLDGPAFRNGIEFSYFIDGVFHRTDGPAHQCDICTQWRQNGNFHRTDGPAYIHHSTGKESYYLEGTEYSKEEWEAKLRPYRSRAINIGRRVAATQINQKLNHITPHPISKNILAYVLGSATLKSNRSEVRKLGTEIRVDALANLGGNFLDQLGKELMATLGAKPLGFEIPEDLGKEAESLKEEIVIENLQELKR